jgi:hypothetical protein
MDDFRDMTARLARFLAEATSRLVFWAEHGRPTPQKPFASLHLLHAAPTRMLPERYVHPEHITVVSRWRLAVSVRFVSMQDGRNNRAATAAFADYITSEDGLQALRGVGLRLVRIGSLRELVEGGEQISVDIDLSWTRDHKEPLETIDAVELECWR